MNQGKRLNNLPILFTLFIILNFIFPKNAFAVCPVCTVAVGAGLGLSRWLGIDDAVSSIWIGGLILSSSFWLYEWATKRKYFQKKSLNLILTVFLMYFIVLTPLCYAKIIGHPFNKILGIDKIVFGISLGSLAFLIGVWANKKVRKMKGRQLFQFQKIIFPIALLVITSLIIYYYEGYLN